MRWHRVEAATSSETVLGLRREAIREEATGGESTDLPFGKEVSSSSGRTPFERGSLE